MDDSLLAEAEAGHEIQKDDGPQPSPPPAESPTTTEATGVPKQATLPYAAQKTGQYLKTLNTAQYAAVTAPATGSMQILAGPGSGKTKVLTSRVAYLLQHYRISPELLVVVTFTNKAANEMRHRLSMIVGGAIVDKVMMGTFHSVCVRYLRKYGMLIGLKPNFVIADRDDCLSIVKRALVSAQLDDKERKDLKPSGLLDEISKCKSHGISPGQFRLQKGVKTDKGKPLPANRVKSIAKVYEEYESALERDNALDFDDLLLRGLQLLSEFPQIVSKVQNVLIDEFQDTNAVQYSLVRVIAEASQSLTTVGDPDQSIYGWRNAEVGNLELMVKDFKNVSRVYLEENYRSTGAILGAALAVVQQDTKRINKGLKATHSTGSSTVLHCAPNASTEADFIAAQIQHLVAHMGGLLDYDDFAILLRYGALSRNIEQSLQKAGVPTRMVGGRKFFERAEVKDILCYLQLADNPAYASALTRVINVPKRGIGDKTILQLVNAAKLKRMPIFEVCIRIANGDDFITVTGAQRKGLRLFVKTVRDLRKMAEEDISVPDLIDSVCEKLGYYAYLQKTHGPEADERWMNVEELKSYAATVATEKADAVAAAEDAELDATMQEAAENDDKDGDYLQIVDENGDEEEIDMPMASQASQAASNQLRTFLATSMLATDTETEESKDDATMKKVTMSTIHAAKGLEWPVVFVPACEEGVIPFYRCESQDEIDEERRLLYVGITRAQGFCFLSHSVMRMAGAREFEKPLSPFLSPVVDKYSSLFVPRLQKITKETRVEMAAVLRRLVPDETEAEKMIQAYEDTLPEDVPTYEYDADLVRQKKYGGHGGYLESGGSSQSRYAAGNGGKWAHVGPRPVPSGSQGFSSALSSYKAAPAASSSSAIPPAASKGKQPLFNPMVSSTAPKAEPYRDILDQPAPPRRAPSTGAFRPPRPASSTSSSTAYKPMPPPPSPKRPASPPKPSTSQGMANVPETRGSMINDAVLVNPVAGEAVPKNLLERFSRKEQARLSDMRVLGADMPDVKQAAAAGTSADDSVDLTKSDSVVASSDGAEPTGKKKTTRKRAKPTKETAQPEEQPVRRSARQPKRRKIED